MTDVVAERDRLARLVGRRVRITVFGCGPGVRIMKDHTAELCEWKVVCEGTVTGWHIHHPGMAGRTFSLHVAGYGYFDVTHARIKELKPWWRRVLEWLHLVRRT